MNRVKLTAIHRASALAVHSKEWALKAFHMWRVYESQRSRYEKQSSPSQRQKRKANRRAFPHGFKGRAA